jgi:hypothetical protein
MEGYWVRTSVKVKLTPAEKRQIDRPSSPRWELDIVAYSGRDNLLKIIECKSYLDSRGVKLHAFDGSNDKSVKRFKLFTEDKVRRVVLNRLRLQFAESGHAAPMQRSNSALELRGQGLQVCEVEFVVGIGEEADAAVVAALNDVDRHLGDGDPGTTGHGASRDRDSGGA